jgi:hypothetical protein
LTAAELFEQYRADWNAALCPCITCLLNACPEAEREALNALLGEHLATSPTPPYSEAQLRRFEVRVADAIAPLFAERPSN